MYFFNYLIIFTNLIYILNMHINGSDILFKYVFMFNILLDVKIILDLGLFNSKNVLMLDMFPCANILLDLSFFTYCLWICAFKSLLIVYATLYYWSRTSSFTIRSYSRLGLSIQDWNLDSTTMTVITRIPIL